MILIDKSQTTNTAVVTVTEMTKVASPVYSLKLFSPYTNKTFNIALPANTSAHTDRFDKFILDTTLFDEIEHGYLEYTISEATDGVVEKGLMKVVADKLTIQQEVDEQFITYTPAETDDDFITYSG